MNSAFYTFDVLLLLGITSNTSVYVQILLSNQGSNQSFPCGESIHNLIQMPLLSPLNLQCIFFLFYRTQHHLSNLLPSPPLRRQRACILFSFEALQYLTQDLRCDRISESIGWMDRWIDDEY